MNRRRIATGIGWLATTASLTAVPVGAGANGGQGVPITVALAEVVRAACFNRSTGERVVFVPDGPSWDCAEALAAQGIEPGQRVLSIFDGTAMDDAGPAEVAIGGAGPVMGSPVGHVERGFCMNVTRYAHASFPVGTPEVPGAPFPGAGGAFDCSQYVPVRRGDRILAGIELVAGDSAPAPAAAAH